MEDKIMTVSTSLVTANVENPIILSESVRERTQFEPSLIDNPNHPELSVNGKLRLTKIIKSTGGFNSPKITRRDISSESEIEIFFDHHQTYNLFQGLKKLYELKASTQIQLGTRTYIEADDKTKQLRDLLTDDNQLSNVLKAATANEIGQWNVALNIEGLRRVQIELEIT